MLKNRQERYPQIGIFCKNFWGYLVACQKLLYFLAILISNFSKIDEVLEMPNLIDMQKSSYEWFIKEGLREVFCDVSPITDYAGNLILEFTDYRIDEQPKYSIEECKERDTNYAAPLRVQVRLINQETGEITASRKGKYVSFYVGSTKATVDGETVELATAPYITAKGKTMVPIRLAAEALDLSVGWSEEGRKVVINS